MPKPSTSLPPVISSHFCATSTGNAALAAQTDLDRAQVKLRHLGVVDDGDIHRRHARVERDLFPGDDSMNVERVARVGHQHDFAAQAHCKEQMPTVMP
jgi:hypothetical protein